MVDIEVSFCVQLTAAIIPGEGFSFDIDRISIANGGTDDHRQRRQVTSSYAGYTGHVRNVIIDDLKLLEIIQQHRADGVELPPGVASVFNTGELTDVEKPIPLNPVTFKSHRSASLPLRSVNAEHSNGSLQVMFRTVEADSLLFFNDGVVPDFLAAELIGGQLWLSANDGGGHVTIGHPKTALDDNAWHLVVVEQLTAKSFRLTVDGVRSDDLHLTTKMNTLDLTGPLFVGGVPDSVAGLDSPHGTTLSQRTYTGCLASVTVDGVLLDVAQHILESPAMVVPGCHSELIRL